VENETKYGRGFTLWFTGLSGAGKPTIAEIELKGSCPSPRRSTAPKCRLRRLNNVGRACSARAGRNSPACFIGSRASELPRIRLSTHFVNKGKKKDRNYDAPVLAFLILLHLLL
jgi:hypothetical protein